MKSSADGGSGLPVAGPRYEPATFSGGAMTVDVVLAVFCRGGNEDADADRCRTAVLLQASDQLVKIGGACQNVFGPSMKGGSATQRHRVRHPYAYVYYRV